MFHCWQSLELEDRSASFVDSQNSAASQRAFEWRVQLSLRVQRMGSKRGKRRCQGFKRMSVSRCFARVQKTPQIDAAISNAFETSARWLGIEEQQGLSESETVTKELSSCWLTEIWLYLMSLSVRSPSCFQCPDETSLACRFLASLFPEILKLIQDSAANMWDATTATSIRCSRNSLTSLPVVALVIDTRRQSVFCSWPLTLIWVTVTVNQCFEKPFVD